MKEERNKTLAYFDGKKTYLDNVCAHCRFFSVSKKPFVADMEGYCHRCKSCYPDLCLCEGPLTEPTDSCKHWSMRSDALKIRCYDDLPRMHELKNDGNKFID